MDREMEAIVETQTSWTRDRRHHGHVGRSRVDSHVGDAVDGHVRMSWVDGEMENVTGRGGGGTRGERRGHVGTSGLGQAVVGHRSWTETEGTPRRDTEGCHGWTERRRASWTATEGCHGRTDNDDTTEGRRGMDSELEDIVDASECRGWPDTRR